VLNSPLLYSFSSTRYIILTVFKLVKFPTKYLYAFQYLHACCVPCQSHTPWFQCCKITSLSSSWRSQWPRALRCSFTAARLLGLWVRIPPGVWMFICCEYCVLSGRGLCYELITRPDESYRLCCVVACDLETSWIYCSTTALYMYTLLHNKWAVDFFLSPKPEVT
jgi:hypothetical protein